MPIKAPWYMQHKASGMECLPEHGVLDDCGDPSLQTWQEANVAAIQRQVKVEVWHLNEGYLYGISDTSVQQLTWPNFCTNEHNGDPCVARQTALWL